MNIYPEVEDVAHVGQVGGMPADAAALPLAGQGPGEPYDGLDDNNIDESTADEDASDDDHVDDDGDDGDDGDEGDEGDGNDWPLGLPPTVNHEGQVYERAPWHRNATRPQLRFLVPTCLVKIYIKTALANKAQAEQDVETHGMTPAIAAFLHNTFVWILTHAYYLPASVPLTFDFGSAHKQCASIDAALAYLGESRFEQYFGLEVRDCRELAFRIFPPPGGLYAAGRYFSCAEGLLCYLPRSKTTPSFLWMELLFGRSQMDLSCLYAAFCTFVCENWGALLRPSMMGRFALRLAEDVAAFEDLFHRSKNGAPALYPAECHLVAVVCDGTRFDVCRPTTNHPHGQAIGVVDTQTQYYNGWHAGHNVLGVTCVDASGIFLACHLVPGSTNDAGAWGESGMQGQLAVMGYRILADQGFPSNPTVVAMRGQFMNNLTQLQRDKLMAVRVVIEQSFWRAQAACRCVNQQVQAQNLHKARASSHLDRLPHAYL